MAIMPRLMASILRILQLVCAAIECGLVVIYMSIVHRLAVPASPAFIFTGVVAILSLLTATLFLILMSLNFKRYPYDLAMFVLWMIAFGLMIKFNTFNGCSTTIYGPAWCEHLVATAFFSVICGVLWLNTVVADFWVSKLHIYRAHHSQSSAPPAVSQVYGERTSEHSL